MASYFAMDTAALQQEHGKLTAVYEAFRAMGLKLDMSRGKPSPEQLDLSLPMLQILDYIDDSGADARNYGHLEGLPEARRFLADMLETSPDETFVGGNSSLQLMYMMVDLYWRMGGPNSLRPWKDEGAVRFLCPVPGYDRHFRIAESFGIELVPVPMTPAGPDMDRVEALVRDEAVKGIWCVPVYSNPDGYTYSAQTVERLVAMPAAAPDFCVFWDNAYGFHHLTPEHEHCPSLLDACRRHGHEDRALVFCSTSKITFAGAGVGALGTSRANIAAFSQYVATMTIGFDKMNQLRHVRYLKQEGGIAAHMEKQAAIVRPKFRAVLDSLRDGLGENGAVAHWTEPRGGYFVSLYAPEGCAKRVVELCGQAGVVFTGAGAAYPYGNDPADSHIRIAPTFPAVAELEAAMRLLCVATRLACVEKLLQGQK